MRNKTYLIDLDGTMYRGNTIIEGAKELIDYLNENNLPYLFLTNNSSRTLKQNVEHMEKMGFTGIEEKHFFTSAMAAAAHVAKTSEKRKCDYIGMDGLKEALLNNGFEIVKEGEIADFLFVGLDRSGTYAQYSQKLIHLLNGAKLVGTNSDRLLANDTGFNVGNGCIVAMFEYASGQKSELIGKPNAPILEEALAYLHKSKEECAIIGDNLETDIKLGVDHGVDTIFVTTGVHSIEDVERLGVEPTMSISTLRSLIHK
ncbi:MAG: HAD-IIA family hydrolase [Erysipelotrichia bacterium]|nr:HAD-IIA family hydrolase [Erysipelotrichia bacterium]